MGRQQLLPKINPQDGHWDSQRDHSQDQDARDATLAQTIAEAVAREMAKAHAHYQAILNEKGTATLQTSLKVSSGSHGFKVMDPFDWTKDKSIYQRWQLWSEKARLALDAMEGDSEKTKISYFHHWINGEGMRHIESWKNSRTLINQSAYDELERKKGKYSSECTESYFILFELLLAPKSNPLLAVEELHFTKQGSMTSREFHSHIVKIAKRCQFLNPEAEERAIRDAIFLGMNSQWARDKAINLLNEEGKELTVDFLMNQLAIEDCNAQHKILSQLNSSSSMNFAAYDRRQNKGKSNKSKRTSGKNVGQNNSGVQTSSNNNHLSRKPPGMEGKCMRCGKPEHQPGQKCAAKNAKCKECHKIIHFYKVCQSKKRGRRANLAQIAPQSEQDTHIDENGVRQPNPPTVNMLKSHPDSMQNESRTSHTSTHSTTGTLVKNIAQLTTSFRTTTPIKAMTGRTNMAQPTTSFRTTPNTAMTGKQVNPVQVPQDTSRKAHLESCMHVHQPVSQVCKPGELLALRKVKHPLNGRTFVSRLPLTKQDILSQYSGCFEGIGRFPGDPYKFHLKPDYKPAQHAPRKVPVHLETAFKEEIESLVKQGILEEVKEHTDWVNSYVIVRKGHWQSPFTKSHS